MMSWFERRRYLEERYDDEKRVREQEIDATYEMLSRFRSQNMRLFDQYVAMMGSDETNLDQLAQRLQELESRLRYQSERRIEMLEDEIRELARRYENDVDLLQRGSKQY